MQPQEKRQDSLSSNQTKRSMLMSMLTRAEVTGEPTNAEELMTEALTRLMALDERAKNTTNIDDFDDIDDEAEEWGTFRAYICPPTEIEHEGNISVNLMEEWGVPRSRVDWMRNSLGSKLTDANVQAARSALKIILMEENSWADYTNGYEDTMKG